ncbi:MAG: hypothetical protein RLZZ165_1858, partial [Bacteroidota bacterium]
MVAKLRNAVLAAAAMMVLLGWNAGAMAAGDAAKGKIAFDANCARCHNANLTQKGTGPALYGVSS